MRARQTGLWHRAPPADPAFDRDALDRAIAMFDAQDKAWEAWFDANGCVPLRITYEALTGDRHATLRKVLGGLDLDPVCALHVTTPTARLADNVTEDWGARMRRMDL